MAGTVLVTTSVYDASCSRSLLDWTIFSVDDERVSVDAFYETALSTCGPGTRQHLTQYKHCVEEVKVGEKMDCLIRIGNTGSSMSISSCIYIFKLYFPC